MCLLLTLPLFGSATEVTNLNESDVKILTAIMSTGGQAFNTKYTHAANTRVEMDCNVTQDHQSRWEALLGGRLNSYMTNAFCFFSRTDGGDIPCFNRSGNEPRGSGFVYGERIKLVCEGKTAKWYKYTSLNTQAGSVTTTGTADAGKTPMLLFNLNTSKTSGGVQIDTSPSVMMLYGCKIYEGTTLKRDYVPAMYNDEVGLYDRVTKTFSGSITETAFVSTISKKIGNLYYILDATNQTAKVTYKDTNYNSYSGDVVIPETVTYDGVTYTVTRIGDHAFQNCINMSSVSIPETVTIIENNGFKLE